MKNEETAQRQNILHTILEKVDSIEKMMIKKVGKTLFVLNYSV